MEALGGLWVAREEAGPGDHFLCTVRICGWEITTEPLLGSKAGGAALPVGSGGAAHPDLFLASLWSPH